MAATATPHPLEIQGGREVRPPKGYHRRKTLAFDPVEDEYGVFQTGDPRVEAQWLLRLVENGETVESVRALIQVPPKIEKVLRGYAQSLPGEAFSVDRGLEFRRSVLEEFDRLARTALESTQNTPEGPRGGVGAVKAAVKISDSNMREAFARG